MTLEVTHGTVTWDGTVLALNDDPAPVTVDGVEIYQALAHDEANNQFLCQWDVWQTEWPTTGGFADWPLPTSVVAQP